MCKSATNLQCQVLTKQRVVRPVIGQGGPPEQVTSAQVQLQWKLVWPESVRAIDGSQCRSLGQCGLALPNLLGDPDQHLKKQRMAIAKKILWQPLIKRSSHRARCTSYKRSMTAQAGCLIRKCAPQERANPFSLPQALAVADPNGQC